MEGRHFDTPINETPGKCSVMSLVNVGVLGVHLHDSYAIGTLCNSN
jgi:hypothetical protein